MPGHWRLRKKWNSQKEIRNQKAKNGKEAAPTAGLSKRRKTISAGEVTACRSKSSSMLHQTTIESPEHTYATGRRHYMRRPALLAGSDNNLHTLSTGTESSNSTSLSFLTVSLNDGNLSFKKTVQVREGRSMDQLLHSVFYKQGLADYVFSDCHITSCKGGMYQVVDMQESATNHLASVIEIQPLKNLIEKSNRVSSSPTDHESVESCLEYFEANGLVEIPYDTQNELDDSFHLPRVTPLEPIESCWEELDIDYSIKESMSNKELAQQQALWELIATEHSFMRQLETVINLFMRALELIRRTGLLREVNYHNVFGYMEEIYLSHEQFWSWTLQPCLEKARQEQRPLELNEIILRFPVEIATDFEIYEQHCAFERTNLKSLDEAMNQKDFRAYLEWCEGQPQCDRLKLKDFLAKPMQRLTKYSLLFRAILTRTTNETHIKELQQMIEDMSMFVSSVNGVLRAQEETQRVEDIMKKIIGYNPIEITGDVKELVQPYLKLDLMAPMPDADITRPRILVVEGKLRYKDNHTRTMVAHVFLFSDMLLITKTRGTDKYVIVKQPFKISQLQVHHKESGTITCIVLNDYQVLTDMFILKAHSADVAQEWADQIAAAQEFYTSAIERKSQSWRLLECLQQERTLNGISQDILAAGDSSGLPHWSMQSISGSPVPSQSGGEFRRVPSCESILSASSSSVFPMDTLSTPDMRRNSSVPIRSASIDHAQLNHYPKCSPPPLDSHRISYPFYNSPGNSPSTQRPVWQRAHSLNTLTGQQSSDHPLLADFKVKRNRNSFQVTLRDATTQTDSSTNDSFAATHLHLSDTDSTTDGDLSPIPISPPTPIDIVISSVNGSIIRTHHRSKSDSTSASLRKKSSCDETHFFQSNTDYHNDLVSSPTSPVYTSKDFLTTNTIKSSPILSKGNRGEHSSSFSYSTDTQSSNEEWGERLSTTLPSGFRMSSSDSRLRQQRHSTFQLSKIYESMDEESDENSEECLKGSSFSRNNNLRRSKSSFELSYSSKPCLKPPSPLTTHMHRSREKLHKLLSYSSNDACMSPVITPKIMFMGISIDDDDGIDVDNEKGKGKRGRVERGEGDPIPSENSSPHNEDTKAMPSRSLWGKRVKSASSTGKGRRGLFGLFRGRAMSVESVLDVEKPAQVTSAMKHKSHTKSSTSKTPNKSSPTRSSESNTSITKDDSKITSSYAHKPNRSVVSLSIDIPSSNGLEEGTPLRTVRKSLELTQPDHRVVFVSSHPPSPSSLNSSNIGTKHRKMQVFPSSEVTVSTIHSY